MIKIWRYYGSYFGAGATITDIAITETTTADGVYTDEVLSSIAASGFNGIWVHGQLHNLVWREEFPELAPLAALHQERMNSLIRRAAKYGIKVYLYMQPPRALPAADEAFWNAHPDVRGQVVRMPAHLPDAPLYRSLCTSTEIVRQYIRNGMADLTRALPGLGGYIIISASEYPAHCYTHRNRENVECPRCGARPRGEVIAELLQTLRDGIREVSADTALIVWNWSWRYNGGEDYIVEHLPEDVIYMADFERGGYQDRLGHKNHGMDEYCISYPGPSEQFVETVEIARKRGLQCCAKLQFGTTHEVADVPNIPLIGNLFLKADYLRKNGIKAFMGCWNFGNMITANTAAFNYFLSDKAPDDQRLAVETFAADYFPGCDAAKAAQAWDVMARAMLSYPFGIPYIYFGPTNWVLAHFQEPAPFRMKTCGRSWYFDQDRADDISMVVTEFTEEEILNGLQALVPGWEEGCRLFEAAVQTAADDRHKREELDNVYVLLAIFRSSVNYFRLRNIRRNFEHFDRAAYNAVSADELENLRSVLPLVERDPRFGFHAEPGGYMFDAASIRAKIARLEEVLASPGM